MNNARCDTKPDRANASAEANDAGPNQRALKIGWTDPLLKPDQEFKPAEDLQARTRVTW